MQIDFYTLEDADYKPVLVRLLKKALAHDLTVYIRTDEAHTTHMLDEYLWTFEDTSFLPHSTDSTDETPILIGEMFPDTIDLCINLAHTPIPDTHAVDRLMEIVTTCPEDKTIRRTHFKQYEKAGHTPNVIRL